MDRTVSRILYSDCIESDRIEFNLIGTVIIHLVPAANRERAAYP